MDQLESIWNIHQINKDIKDLKAKKKALEDNENLEEVLVKIQEREYDVTNYKTKVQVDEAKVQRLNQKFKQINFKLEEINKKLYSGDISNPQKLTSLQEEGNELKDESEGIENQIILLLDSIEKDTVKLYEFEKDYENFKIKYKKLIKSNKEDIKKTIKSIKGLEEEVNRIEADLDKNILDRYKKIKKKKEKAIVRIEGDKCTGCHMSIPLSTISKIKKGEKLINCDNCGRILYYEMEKITT